MNLFLWLWWDFLKVLNSFFAFGLINLWISFHICLSLGVINVSAQPSAPARAVLPILWIKSSGTCGRWKLITCWIDGTSKPLAASSVLTRIRIFSERNEINVLCLLDWRKFPCIQSQECPSLRKRSTILSALRLVLTKSKIEPFLICNWSSNVLYLSLSLTCITSCLILVIGVVVDPTLILAGSFKYLSAILTIFCGRVAENNNVWCFLGTCFNICSICGVKPISSILSVSSRTKK